MATTPRGTRGTATKAGAAGTAPDQATAPAYQYDPANFVATLSELRQPVDPAFVRQREGWRDRNGNVNMVDYVEWHHVTDILDDKAPGWQSTVKDIRQIGEIIAMTVAITIDGITREGVGCGVAQSEMGIKKAEHDALKRAAVKFGIARALYQKESHIIDQQGDAGHVTNNFNRGGGGGYSGQQGGYSGQQGGGYPQQQGFPDQPIARNLNDAASAKQLGMIRVVAKHCNINPDEECQAVMRCNHDELTRRAASAFIQHLQAIERGEIYPAGEDNERDFNYNPNAQQGGGQQRTPSHTGGGAPPAALPAGTPMISSTTMNAIRILCHNLQLNEGEVAGDASEGRASRLDQLTAQEGVNLHEQLKVM